MDILELEQKKKEKKTNHNHRLSVVKDEYN